ncbi:MAG: hypothetical protein A2W90_10700 [Bacteroidetes bacterium GWF2_42_66]|nr:MAG: hypothetical protein A2W92_09690 [Bacteroidetes bacterium GWA2_42_15]OFY01951.1 MAG: hypothetical protein A2W89_23870 [Bacteroidetes bacterium GWE2_42_39]OFY44753.1 MAG: hypothetical protein A2W90_10700 [Bacteroidetes bacterium GWF2_42_66]HBL75876.1 hypothetical protein [Prolixibacteraceae bacterium]HCU61992.1 hypothetical protein [Prolixibacteraceae bacterium]
MKKHLLYLMIFCLGIGTLNAQTFVKGVNFGGNAITIDGNTWLSHNDAIVAGMSIGSALTYRESVTTWSPAADANVTELLNTGIYKTGANPVNISIPLTNGKYTVYVWTAEDYKDNFRYGNLNIEGTLAGTIDKMAKFAWKKYGPFETTVSDGVLNVDLVGYNRDPQINGLAVFSSSATGIDKLQNTDRTMIYPNPCNGRFSLKNKNDITAVEIYTVSGKKIHTLNNINQDRIEEIDISEFPDGVYFMRLFTGEKYSTQKLIIRKD